MPKKSKQTYQTLKGFKDTMPDEQKYWDFIYNKARQASLDYGFKKIDTPILEDARIYIKGTGKHSDIVEKELYSFEDKGGNKVALRPEFTPGILRAYIQHGMVNQPQPVKLFSFGPIFRHDKPQAGRLRQFNQFNFEVVGSSTPETDSQFITTISSLYKSFGLDIVVELNSIGCIDCRNEYIKKLKVFLRKQDKLCPICEERVKTNPLRVLDCKNKSCIEVTQEAPQIVDYLCNDCKDHFVKVLENLDEVNVVYNLNPRLVRGLDYYTRTTFEIYISDEQSKELQPTGDEHEERRIALGGGGRYDGLMEILGGRPTPAVGLGGGVERIISVLKRLRIEIEDPTRADVFIAQLGEEAKKKSIKLFEQMRLDGIKVREAFGKNGLKGQLEVADKANVKYALILGQKEIIDSTIIIRDMETGIQEIVVFDNVVEEIKDRLAGSNDVRVYKNGVSEQHSQQPEKTENTEKADSSQNNENNPVKEKVQILPPADASGEDDDDDDDDSADIYVGEEDDLEEAADKILETTEKED